MGKALALIASAVLFCGCETIDPVAIENAQVYFPPLFKVVDEPRFCFEPAERERALQEYRELEANTLFELVIDRAGQVKQARIVTTRHPEHRRADMLAHARRMVFSEDPESSRYRAFYLPMQYGYESEFEWIE